MNEGYNMKTPSEHTHVMLECDTHKANTVNLEVEGNPETAINLFVLGISKFIDQMVRKVLESTGIKSDDETVQKNKDVLLHIIFSNLLTLNDRESKEAK